MEGFYPGSKTPRRSYTEQRKPEPEKQADIDLGKPRQLRVGTQVVDFYTVGTLALALNRKTVTIRKWEQEGIIPKAQYIRPSDDARGQRRLYTKDQIMGLRELARQEGILYPSDGGKWSAVEQTKFRDRSAQLWKELEGSN